MKKWNNPELLSLGVENTFSQEKFHHPCHKVGNGSHSGNCTADGTGHPAIETGKCLDHPNTAYTINGKSYSCCCSDNLVEDAPGLS